MYLKEFGNINYESKFKVYPRHFMRIQKSKRSKNTKKVRFFDAIRSTLFVCRCMSMLPIKGLGQPDSRKSSHTWKSPYSIIFTYTFVVQFIHKLLAFYYGVITQDVMEVPKLSTILVTFTIFFSFLHLITFSNNWDKMKTKIETIEEKLPSFPRKSVRCMNIILWTLIIEAILFFALYQAQKYQAVLLCHKHAGDSGLYIKSMSLKDLESLFNIIPFSYFTAFIFQIGRIQNSFIWTFCDILVINICYYLAVRFQQFNTILNQKETELSVKNSNDFSLPWSEMQQHYTRLMKLVYILDQNIHPMVFFSCLNLVFIGKQIYFALNAKDPDVKSCTNEFLEVLKLCYYVFASASVVMRVFLVCSVASRVHTLSRKALDKLYTCPAYAYDKSCERFIDQVFHSNVSLSGFRCFFITKRTILSMLATLLTYELLLLQNL